MVVTTLSALPPSVFTPAANSTYHAGTIQLERRLSSVLTFQATYTRSKAIDDVRTPMNYYNRSPEKSRFAFHAPNQFVLSSVYEFPFGRDRAIASNWGRPADAILGVLPRFRSPSDSGLQIESPGLLP